MDHRDTTYNEWNLLLDDMAQAIVHTELVAVSRRKRLLVQYLQVKTSDMTLRLQIMRLKYAVYQRYMDWFSLAIIVISTTTAVTEAVKGELGLNNSTTTAPSTYHFMQLLPVFTSSTTGFLASIIKFKKYAEKLEDLGRTIEKTITTTARVNRIIEQITGTRTLTEVENQDMVVSDILEAVSDAMSHIASVLEYTDVVRYMPTYHTLTLSHLRSEKQFEAEANNTTATTTTASAPHGLRRCPCRPTLSCVLL